MVYTDGIHLVADTEDELHGFAKGIGLPRNRFVDGRHKHYPLVGNMVNKAILSGAVNKDCRFLINLTLNTEQRNNSLTIV